MAIVVGYTDTVEFAAYALSYGVTIPALEAEQAVLLNKSLRWLELQPFKGEKTDSAQVLEFPRDGDTEVPPKIIQAQLEGALVYNSGGDMLLPVKQRVLSNTVDEAVTRTYSDKGTVNPTYPQLTALLRDYLISGGYSAVAVRI